MRLLVVLLTILLVLNLLGFVLTNLETRVDVTIWKTQYHDVPLMFVVILSVVAGIVYLGVIALAEGANLRIANHRLQREIQKLETELNYLRTQPPSAPPAEPDALLDPPWSDRAGPRAATDEPGLAPASAPVYEAEEAWENGPGDDGYSGGGSGTV